MNDCEDDPRLSDEHVRTIPGANGTVTLVGVVHDHPASAYRARSTVADQTPDVLALELPPLAVPLFRQYARDSRVPPAFGGEMSAAIQASSGERVVGIDGPTVGFSRKLLETLYRTNASLETTLRVGRGVLSATKQAIECRTASVLASIADVRIEVDPPISYETDWRDEPERQAADERKHLDRARSVLNVLEPPRATRVRDTARERYMADRLEELSHEGDVVAVVGRSHLEAVAGHLTDDAVPPR